MNKILFVIILFFTFPALAAYQPVPGTNGQFVYNNNGQWAAATMGGDCTLSPPNITCTKINGATPVTSWTGDTVLHNNSASTGAVTETLATQTANTVLAGPTSGSAATPTFRALTTADVPAVHGATIATVALTSYNGL